LIYKFVVVILFYLPYFHRHINQSRIIIIVIYLEKKKVKNKMISSKYINIIIQYF
jgi:hypothetical protein